MSTRLSEHCTCDRVVIFKCHYKSACLQDAPCLLAGKACHNNKNNYKVVKVAKHSKTCLCRFKKFFYVLQRGV